MNRLIPKTRSGARRAAARLDAQIAAAQKEAREAGAAWEISTRNGPSAYATEMSRRSSEAADLARSLAERRIAILDAWGAKMKPRQRRAKELKRRMTRICAEIRTGKDTITLTHWKDSMENGAILSVRDRALAMATLTPETAKALRAALGIYLRHARSVAEA